MSSGFVDICGYVFALMFAFFWFNLNLDRNLFHTLPRYVGGIQSHWPKIKVMETGDVLEFITILNSRMCKSPQPISGIQ